MPSFMVGYFWSCVYQMFLYLKVFSLFVPQNFYMIGRDKSRTYWKVLKIDRLEPSELSVLEDSTTYTESECSDLLRRIHEGNRSTGGLKFVTTCYGIIGMLIWCVFFSWPLRSYEFISWFVILHPGFIKFLGPYYMVVITKRRKIGAICGHTVYAVSKSEMISLQNPSVQSNIDENRSLNFWCYIDFTFLVKKKNWMLSQGMPIIYVHLYLLFWNRMLLQIYSFCVVFQFKLF